MLADRRRDRSVLHAAPILLLASRRVEVVQSIELA